MNPKIMPARSAKSWRLSPEKQNDVPYATQARFFQQHIASWMTTFFKDLESAKSAGFYRVVGSFGSCFLESESEYLKYGAKGSMPHKRRRNRR